MKKQIRQNRIFTGKTDDNWFLDYPRFIKTKKDSFYKLNVGEKYDFILVFDKSLFSNDDKISYTITLPLTPISDDDGTAFNFIVDWGDNSQVSQVTSYNDFKNSTHTYSNANDFLTNLQNGQNQFKIRIFGNLYGFNNKQYIEKTNKNAWDYLIRIQQWNSISCCKNFNYAFYEANNLSSLPEGNFPIDLVTANNCFQNCISLIELPDVFNLSQNLESCNNFFQGCTGLCDISNTTLSINNSVKSCAGMFKDCINLKYIPDTLFSSQLTKNLNSFFQNCISLESLPDTFNFPQQLEHANDFFKNCSVLTGLNNTQLTTTDVAKSCSGMFQNCKKLKNISENFYISKNVKNLNSFFQNCISLKEIPSSFRFSTRLNTLVNFAANCSSLIEIPDTVWPDGGFSLKYDFSVNIVSAFYNCNTASGFAPNYFLWDSNVHFDPVVKTGNTNDLRPLTFQLCKKLNNYNMIPNYWRTDQTIILILIHHLDLKLKCQLVGCLLCLFIKHIQIIVGMIHQKH